MYVYALLLIALPLEQPAPAPPNDSALRSCIAANRDGESGRATAEAAEKHYRSLLAREPANSRYKTLLARAISQCVMRHASLWSKEGLVKESNRLLTEVLSRDSTSWEARYALALNYYHAPRFFGWTDDAIREFEHLLAQQGTGAEFAEQAGPYLYLGILYDKKGRHADAAAIWQRGSRLFPSDQRLRERTGAAP